MIIDILVFLAIGLLAGWLAGLIWKGGGFGLIGNIVVGVIGALVGGFVLKFIGFQYSSLIPRIIAAVIGALILLWIINFVKK